MAEKRPRILIAEDEIATRMMLARFVEQLGAEPVCAADGQEAIERAHEIDLALIDADMPVVNGFDCTGALNQCYQGQLPILIVTALDDEESIDRAFSCGAMDYIAKPINWAVLRNRVLYLLKARENQQALATAQSRKEALIHNAADAIISVDRHGKIQEFNPAAATLFGYSKEEARNHINIGHLLPDYFQLEQKVINTPEKEHNTSRFESLGINRLGDNFSIEISLSVCDPGNSQLTTIMLHDISERKQHEQEQRLAATVFNFCNEGIMITNDRNEIVAVNPSFSDITGFSADEIIGKDPSILQSGCQDKSFYNEMWSDITESGSWQGEIINQRKDGSHYNEWLSIRSVFDHSGDKVRNYVAIFSDISDRKKAEQKIWWQAHHDSLTLLPNRSLFMQTLSQQIAETCSAQLFFIDMDGFKAVNDSLGHQKGDEVLIETAERLRQALPHSRMIARLGGDEFVVVFNSQDSLASLYAAGMNLVKELSKPYQCIDGALPLSASIGLAAYPQHANSADELISVADQLMYKVKSEGKAGISLPDSSHSLVC